MASREEINQRILNGIPDNFDKREGSFFYLNSNAVAGELENNYSDLDLIENEIYIQTISKLDNMKNKAVEFGITWNDATKASGVVVFTGNDGTLIPKGTLIANETLNYQTLNDVTISGTTVSVGIESTVSGTIGNTIANSIIEFPVPLAGVTDVTNPTALTNGTDAETLEELRVRTLEAAQEPAVSGNKYHYRKWALDVSGVGDCKVFPLENGNGTVTVTIIDSNKAPAQQSLIDAVKNYIDPSNGQGEGQAPIGATLTVDTATELTINITVDLTLQSGYDDRTIKDGLEISIGQHLKEITFKQDEVRYSDIFLIIKSTTGIIDLNNLLLNGSSNNIILNPKQIPKIGSVS